MPSIQELLIEQIAQRIYGVIRAININFRRTDYPEWAEAPEENRTTFIDGVKFHLDHPELSAKETHDWWCRDKAAKGWRFGPVKDSAGMTHPSLVPFEQLSELEQAKDVLFAEMTKQLSRHGPLSALTQLTGAESVGSTKLKSPQRHK